VGDLISGGLQRGFFFPQGLFSGWVFSQPWLYEAHQTELYPFFPPITNPSKKEFPLCLSIAFFFPLPMDCHPHTPGFQLMVLFFRT